MQFGQTLQTGIAARRRAASGPLAANDRILDAQAGAGAAKAGNALSAVTGGRRPHRVTDVVAAAPAGLAAGVTVLDARADVPAIRMQLAFATVSGGSAPYQVTAIDPAQAG